MQMLLGLAASLPADSVLLRLAVVFGVAVLARLVWPRLDRVGLASGLGVALFVSVAMLPSELARPAVLERSLGAIVAPGLFGLFCVGLVVTDRAKAAGAPRRGLVRASLGLALLGMVVGLALQGTAQDAWTLVVLTMPLPVGALLAVVALAIWVRARQPSADRVALGVAAMLALVGCGAMLVLSPMLFAPLSCGDVRPRDVVWMARVAEGVCAMRMLFLLACAGVLPVLVHARFRRSAA